MLLKVTGLVGLVDRPAEDTTWGAMLPALLLGGLIGVIDYSLWGRFAPRLARRLGGETDRNKVRLIRAFGDFPLAAYVAVVLPLDLLIVGPEVFSTTRIEGSFPMVWAALSVALALSATAWTIFLMHRGIEAACRVRGRATVLMLAFGLSIYLAVAAVFVGLIKLLGVFFG